MDMVFTWHMESHGSKGLAGSIPLTVPVRAEQILPVFPVQLWAVAAQRRAPGLWTPRKASGELPENTAVTAEEALLLPI